MDIRVVSERDAEDLLEIYAYYVENTAISFDYTVPTVAEFREKIRSILETHPFLAATEDGVLLGYAYASPFKQRAAYARSVETSIYVRHDMRKRGVGKALYAALENALKLQNILNMNACIASPASEDPYLTGNSIEYHEHMGFRLVGEFYKCGYKFNRWYNMVWMEKHIGTHTESPLPVRPFGEILGELKEKYGIC